MRPAILAGVMVLLAGCAHPAQRPPQPSAPTASPHLDPDNIRRVRRDLPPGYEVKPATGMSAPQTIWAIGARGAANPVRCAILADPSGGHGQAAQGVSGSGPGGTVYAVVVTAPAALDRSLLGQCGQWTMSGSRARARVHLVDAPPVGGADTLGMVADIITSVEGGNEIGSRAGSFIAYLGDCYAFTTVVSDPGSPDPSLPAQFAADLLVKTVSALRGQTKVS